MYGGTKTEMERLLADATKLTGVKYDISNLSDVYNAIHAVQGELGITGTTAKEASSTFSGSLDSMKSAYSNVMSNMSLGRDMEGPLNALAETTSTFFVNNFIPMVGNILKTLPSAISTFFQAAAPSFALAGTAIMNQFGMGISTGITGLLPKIQATLSPLITGFKTAFSQLPVFFQTVVSTITPIIETIAIAFTKLDFSGFQSLMTSLIPAIQNAFTTMMTIVSPAIDTIVNSFVNMWNSIQPLITILSSALMPVLQIVGSFLGGVLKGVLIGISGAFDAISVVVKILTPIISFLIDVFKLCVPALTVVAEWIGVAVGLFGNLGGAGKTLASILKSAWTNIKSAISIAGNSISKVISVIKTAFSKLGSAGSALKTLISKVWNGIKSVISTVGSAIGKVISSIKSFFTSLSSAGTALKSGITSAWNGMKSIISSVASKITGIVDKVKGAFNSLKEIDISEAGKAIMNGFLGGLKAAYENVKEFIGGIGEWIKDHKGPISYDRKLLIPAGNAIMGGLNSSLQNSFKDVQKTVSGMADSLNSDFNLTTNMAVETDRFNISKLTSASSQGNSETPINSGMFTLQIENFNNYNDTDVKKLGQELQFMVNNMNLAKGRVK